MIETLQNILSRSLVPILKPILDPFHALLEQAPPFSWRLLVCAYIVLGVGWVLFLDRKTVMDGSPGNSKWYDLRIWSGILLVPYLIIYLTL
jgi:hypothetical protein